MKKKRYEQPDLETIAVRHEKNFMDSGGTTEKPIGTIDDGEYGGED